jgi:hypothetical protein
MLLWAGLFGLVQQGCSQAWLQQGQLFFLLAAARLLAAS